MEPSGVQRDVRRQLLKALRADSVSVQRSGWKYCEEGDTWYLHLRMPDYDRRGPRAAYRVIQRAARRHSVPIMLDDVKVQASS